MTIWPHPAVRPLPYTLDNCFWSHPRFESLLWRTKFTVLVEGFIFFLSLQIVFIQYHQNQRKQFYFVNIKCINTIWPFWTQPRVGTRTFGDRKFTILVEDRAFWSTLLWIQFFLQICGSRKEDFLNFILYALKLYGNTGPPKAWTPDTGAMNVTIKVEEFVDLIAMHSVFSPHVLW